MRKKVCMIITDHPALDDRIFYKEAKSLHNAGFDVTLIAPLNQDGFLTDMGMKPIAHEETLIDGIKIIGFRKGEHSLFGLPKTWTISQWLRLSVLGYINLGQEPISDIIKKAVEVNADIYHCHEIWSLYAGIHIKKIIEKTGASPKLIYDVHEFWSAKKSQTFREKNWSRIIRQFEKNALKYVDYAVVVNDLIRGYLVSVNHALKVEVLYNCPSLSIFQEYVQESIFEKVIICHEGHLSFDRGLKEIFDVMTVLKQRYNGRFKFLIIGDLFGKEREYFERTSKDYEMEHIIEITGWLPYEELGHIISNCSIGIIFMDPRFSENIYFSSPNKLFNYMRYGLPVVTVDLPEIRRIVLESQCGIVVKERTVDALVKALSMLIENADLRQRLGENGRKAVYEKYNWGKMEERLLRVYDELTSPSKFVLGTY